jgi:hypothetical protein
MCHNIFHIRVEASGRDIFRRNAFPLPLGLHAHPLRDHV